ncbi:MAG: hypothetical protein HYX74_01130 [Acidobacteria bacterium]|nr:hypothetical protein [Acidobacteriota bacterium]
MNFNEWEENKSPGDRKLDTLLAQTMEVSVPEDLMGWTMRRLPAARTLRFSWWAWAVYVGFFSAAVLGSAYWQWEVLVSLPAVVALAALKAVTLAAQYPSVAMAVAAAFLINALAAWLAAADWMLRKRLAGVGAS